MSLLLRRRARRGSTLFGRLGDLAQQPPFWAAVAGALALGGRSKGKRAAARGTASYAAAAIVTNLAIKPLVDRRRPTGNPSG